MKQKYQHEMQYFINCMLNVKNRSDTSYDVIAIYCGDKCRYDFVLKVGFLVQINKG